MTRSAVLGTLLQDTEERPRPDPAAYRRERLFQFLSLGAQEANWQHQSRQHSSNVLERLLPSTRIAYQRREDQSTTQELNDGNTAAACPDLWA